MFIRTNTTIVDLSKYDIVHVSREGIMLKDKGKDFSNVENRHYIDYCHIVKQGETIDQVCDGFLFKHNDEQLGFIYCDLKNAIAEAKAVYDKIYGIIEKRNGIDYVAVWDKFSGRMVQL